jgi:hypothetical protein
MEEDKLNLLTDFLANHMLQLSLSFYTINKASKKFDLPKELVRIHYCKVRTTIRIIALRRAFIYFIIGGIALFIGLKGSFRESSNVFLYGALLVGTGGVLTSIGLLILGIKGFIRSK